MMEIDITSLTDEYERFLDLDTSNVRVGRARRWSIGRCIGCGGPLPFHSPPCPVLERDFAAGCKMFLQILDDAEPAQRWADDGGAV